VVDARRLFEVYEKLLESEPKLQNSLLNSLEKEDPDLFFNVKELLDIAHSGLSKDLTNGLARQIGMDFKHFNSEGKGQELLVRDILLGKGIAVTGEMGQGGMGKVYEAWDKKMQRKIAVKVIHRLPITSKSKEYKALQEAFATSRLQHSSIVTLYDYFIDGFFLFLIMEYVPGTTLDVFFRNTEVGCELFQEIIVGIVEGMGWAHDHGVVHRDLKPKNIMVTHYGKIKLLDFGIACFFQVPVTGEQLSLPTTAGQHGIFQGTIPYCSPEQARGEMALPSSDYFSLGVLAYELLFDSYPFPGENPADLLVGILNNRRSRPGGSQPEWKMKWLAIIDRCLNPDPSRRFADSKAFLEAIKTPAKAKSMLSRRKIIASVPVGISAIFLVWIAKSRHLLQPGLEPLNWGCKDISLAPARRFLVILSGEPGLLAVWKPIIGGFLDHALAQKANWSWTWDNHSDFESKLEFSFFHNATNALTMIRDDSQIASPINLDGWDHVNDLSSAFFSGLSRTLLPESKSVPFSPWLTGVRLKVEDLSLFFRGMEHYQAGQLEESRRRFSILLQKHPNFAFGQLWLSRCHSAFAENELAWAWLSRGEDTINASSLELALIKAQKAMMGLDYKGARDMWREAELLGASKVEVNRQLSHCECELGNFRQALCHLEIAKNHKPGEGMDALQIGFTLVEEGSFALALQHMESLPGNTSNSFLVTWCSCLAGIGLEQWKSASAHIENLQMDGKDFPRSIGVQCAATLNMVRGDYEAAIGHLETALKDLYATGPSDQVRRLTIWLARLHLLVGQARQARSYMAEANFAHIPTSPPNFRYILELTLLACELADWPAVQTGIGHLEAITEQTSSNQIESSINLVKGCRALHQGSDSWQLAEQELGLAYRLWPGLWQLWYKALLQHAQKEPRSKLMFGEVLGGRKGHVLYRGFPALIHEAKKKLSLP
jgi:serine/threonine protein kinase